MCGVLKLGEVVRFHEVFRKLLYICETFFYSPFAFYFS